MNVEPNYEFICLDRDTRTEYKMLVFLESILYKCGHFYIYYNDEIYYNIKNYKAR